MSDTKFTPYKMAYDFSNLKTNYCLLLKSYIVSDCDAIRVMRDAHGYTAEDAVAASLKAGK